MTFSQYLLKQLETPLPYCVAVCFIFWSFIHNHVSDYVIRAALPRSTHKRLMLKREQDSGINKICRANATALIHAALTVPLALGCCLVVPSLRENPFDGSCIVFDFLSLYTVYDSGWVMCGYFLWDIQICVRHYKQYGFIFLLHAVLCFVSLYIQAAATKVQLVWLCLLLMGSELSTPFLHLRWFCTTARDTESLFFKINNILFLVTFFGYRLFFVQVFAIIPFVTDYIHGGRTHAMSTGRGVTMMSTVLLWTAMNLYWGVLLIKTQIKLLRKKSTVKESD